MTVEGLLQELRRLGVQLYADGNRLRFRAPPGAYTPELRRLVGEHRQALLALLCAQQEEGGRTHCAQRTHSEDVCAQQEEGGRTHCAQRTHLWDVARADSVLAEINALWDRAVAPGGEANTQARQNVAEAYRAAAARLHHKRDDLLWQTPAAAQALLARWHAEDAPRRHGREHGNPPQSPASPAPVAGTSEAEGGGWCAPGAESLTTPWWGDT
jgi:hypothetical protein